MMYDLVMSLEGGLTADRDLVSKDAKRVWSYYKGNRPDVKKKPFDDIHDPKTPPTIDDAELHPGGKKNALNYAYFASKTPNINKLLSNHKAMKSWLKKNNISIEECADLFFELKYYE